MDLQEILLRELNFQESPNLDTSPQWTGLRNIPYVNAVYSVENTRIAYFSEFSELNQNQLLDLYKSVWNESEVALLYVSLPYEVRIYNCYNEPPETPDELDSQERLLKHLTNIIDAEKAVTSIRSDLSNFDRIHLDSETFWDTEDAVTIRRERRADQQLLRAIMQVKQELIVKHKLPNEIAYDMLGRSIFVQYLEDRGFLSSDLVLQLTNNQSSSYRGVLEDFDTTYQFFENLSIRFSGDIFPVRKEEKNKVRTTDALFTIRDFLNGGMFVDIGIQQLSFWPFDFRYIPIGFISGIYDIFVEERKTTGSYYTSHTLVDFILEETLSVDKTDSNMKILDPACGSGVFLVRAYQRLVDAWIIEHDYAKPTLGSLAEILSSCIYGCDISASAARIAVFNLYLAMLDYLEISSMSDSNFTFPKLLDKNIFSLDFFSTEFAAQFINQTFDRIVGNPPWGKDTLTPAARRIIVEQEFEGDIGGKQIAQVFMLYAPKLCKSSGEIAFIAPAKSTLLVKSGTHTNFRQRFFQENSVRLIVNLSALRHELFGGAISPSIVAFYKPRTAKTDHKIAYFVPKPSPLFQHSGAILIDASDVKFLDLGQAEETPTIWKTVLWGTHRDVSLIARLKKFPSLQTIAKQLGWEIGRGFEVKGGKRKSVPWLERMQHIPTRDFDKYRSYAVQPALSEEICLRTG